MSSILTVCPVCDATTKLSSEVQPAEVISCTDCRSRLVIESLTANKAVLKEAPEVEEDWGE